MEIITYEGKRFSICLIKQSEKEWYKHIEYNGRNNRIVHYYNSKNFGVWAAEYKQEPNKDGLKFYK
jgi:hypothetical protein